MQGSLVLIAAFMLQGATCVVCLLVFLSLKNEIRRLRSRVAVQDFTGRLEAMNTRIDACEDRAGAPLPPPPVRQSLNLTKRSQVIRLSRRGERPETIAATLSLPRREVDLMLK